MALRLRTGSWMLAIALAGWSFSGATLADGLANKLPVQVAQVDYLAYIGTWEGTSPKGVAIKLVIPDTVVAGGKVRYWWKGEEQPAYTPLLQGNTIKLTNSSGNDLFIGPVNANALPFKWVAKQGGNSVETTLTRD